MLDPFAAALRALFNAPGSAAAIYTAPGAAPVPLRAIVTAASVDMQVADHAVRAGSTLIQLRRADVPDPVVGALVDVGDRVVELLDEPRLDVEGLTWMCEAAVPIV